MLQLEQRERVRKSLKFCFFSFLFSFCKDASIDSMALSRGLPGAVIIRPSVLEETFSLPGPTSFTNRLPSFCRLSPDLSVCEVDSELVAPIPGVHLRSLNSDRHSPGIHHRLRSWHLRSLRNPLAFFVCKTSSIFFN